MIRRRSLSPTARERIFTAHRGVCHICGDVIDGVRQPWDVDHVIPLALGGEDEEANMAPAHAACHRGASSKTSEDVKRIAKAKRVQRKHIGAHKPKAKIPYRRFDGTPVYPGRDA